MDNQLKSDELLILTNYLGIHTVPTTPTSTYLLLQSRKASISSRPLPPPHPPPPLLFSHHLKPIPFRFLPLLLSLFSDFNSSPHII